MLELLKLPPNFTSVFIKEVSYSEPLPDLKDPVAVFRFFSNKLIGSDLSNNIVQRYCNQINADQKMIDSNLRIEFSSIPIEKAWPTGIMIKIEVFEYSYHSREKLYSLYVS